MAFFGLSTKLGIFSYLQMYQAINSLGRRILVLLLRLNFTKKQSKIWQPIAPLP
jgi:hypothetical protein